MPRIPHSLLHQAASISRFLPSILRTTRDLSSARSELHWINEEIQHSPSTFFHRLSRLPYLPPLQQPTSRIRHRPQCKWARRLEQLRLRPSPVEKALRRCARLRARHYPLQYILGTQPFHLLDVVVRPGVLIPRPETEELTTHLARLLEVNHSGPLNVVDFCAGTGCIGMLLSCLVKKTTSVGLDISKTALSCMQDNKRHHKDVLSASGCAHKPVFYDALSPASETADFLGSQFDGGSVDLIVSNPPYISSQGFNKDTSRSVRLWEPKLALVPDGGNENIFYERIIDVAGEVNAKGIVFEVGGWDQAREVQRLMEERGFKSGIWADFCGKGRTVVGFRDGGWKWLLTPPSLGDE